ncbi:hypothetical protein DL96DRAFT_1456474, partial [Flagelloscypha sp. PMI_526]
DLSGKTAIVTGANVGIGLEIARGLAVRGATVVLACRSAERAQAAKEDIIKSSDGRVQDGQLVFLTLDCADLDSVRNFIKEWGQRPFDILVNNAGTSSGYWVKSPQGFEITYATNILSHYLLTLSLLRSMSQGGRIINVGSVGHYDVQTQIDPLDLDHSKTAEKIFDLKDGQGLSVALTLGLYAKTKLLQVFFTRELQLRLALIDDYKAKKLSVHCYHPGLVKSSLWDRETVVNRTKVINTAMKIMQSLASQSLLNVLPVWAPHQTFYLVTTTEGAATALHLASSDEPANNPGGYWYRMKLSAPNRLAEDVEVSKMIFDQMAAESGLDEHLRL